MQYQTGRKSSQPDKRGEILQAAATQFAENGFAAVSIRDLARAVNTTPAALYHHFSGKEAIYRATLEFVFSDKARATSDLAKGQEAPEVMLERLIVWLTRQFSDNPIMTRLLQRELLTGDKERIKLLTKEVVAAPFREIESLMRRLAPDHDDTLSAVSVLSLVLGYVELTPVLEEMTGQPVTHERDMAFANHASHLVLQGLSPQPDAGKVQ
ncbi:TetR/AcrR family transcriptional regulator [Seohaeicola saemankumensis]|jgi:AcrR family transcriptional regulator|uniref:TetR/AcrR family transcriptional regulator n=1 Tax=Seohaeicola saemankumensis TaxID=481181 RepID=UPI001E5CC00C|nr:TetR/AcrR family transcriptional regulator [Seohaeicola saemankumensis]MCD1627981.1 TetR/AcrR family transcriptional regulator [Seohaeicola saemankumensis]